MAAPGPPISSIAARPAGIDPPLTRIAARLHAAPTTTSGMPGTRQFRRTAAPTSIVEAT